MAQGASSINVEKDIRAIVAEVLEEDDPEKIDGAAHFVKDFWKTISSAKKSFLLKSFFLI